MPDRIPVKSVEIIPYDNPFGLYAVATAEDGTRYAYKRRFPLVDEAHAKYFARLIVAAGSIESAHWSEAK